MMQVVFVVLHKTELLQDLLTKLKKFSRNDFLYSRK